MGQQQQQQPQLQAREKIVLQNPIFLNRAKIKYKEGLELIPNHTELLLSYGILLWCTASYNYYNNSNNNKRQNNRNNGNNNGNNGNGNDEYYEQLKESQLFLNKARISLDKKVQNNDCTTTNDDNMKEETVIRKEQIRINNIKLYLTKIKQRMTILLTNTTSSTATTTLDVTNTASSIAIKAQPQAPQLGRRAEI